MKAKQAINLLENGIMPCILTSSITPISNGAAFKTKVVSSDNLSSFINSYQINYICGYSLNSFHRSSINRPLYRFITLNGKSFYANNLDEEISINNNSGGGEVK